MNPVQTDLIYPMFVMFVLTYGVLVRMFLARKKSILAGETAMSYYKTYNQGAEAPEAAQAARHYINLFEAPVLFYVVCILGMILPVQTIIFTILAWIFVAVRIAHAVIHMGKNKIGLRMKAFGTGILVLAFMWIVLILKTLNIAFTG